MKYHSVMIEVNKSLYMGEYSLMKDGGFDKLKRELRALYSILLKPWFPLGTANNIDLLFPLCFFWKVVGMSFIGTFVRLLLLRYLTVTAHCSFHSDISTLTVLFCFHSNFFSFTDIDGPAPLYWLWWYLLSILVASLTHLWLLYGTSCLLPHTFHVMVTILMFWYTSYIGLWIKVAVPTVSEVFAHSVMRILFLSDFSCGFLWGTFWFFLCKFSASPCPASTGSRFLHKNHSSLPHFLLHR